MRTYLNLIVLFILFLSGPYRSLAKETPRFEAKKAKAVSILAEPQKSTATKPEKKIKGKTFKNTIGQEFVRIEPGSFMMGSPYSDSYMDDDEIQRSVTLSHGYYIQTKEVTQGQWKAVMGSSPWAGKDYVREGDNYPATYISWNDTQEFIKKLNKKEGTAKYRLPTQAQWEYACRAGSKTAYSFGESASLLGEYGWHIENTWNIGEKYAHKVGQKQPNIWGLYDMHGNVWEWCSNWHGDNSPGSATDPEGPPHGLVRVYCGGSWNNNARFCRSSDLVRSKPGFRYFSLGFRLVRIK